MTRQRLGAALDDRVVATVLAVTLAVLTAVTWRKWGNPEIDAGAELTTADLVADGAVPYRDVRYFYGPAGLYSLALVFKVFGSSFTAAFVFGFAQTVAILAAFFALARHWLRPAAAGLATAVVMAIGFSGTAFNFVLPHTNSATFGLLFVLLELLALTRGRLIWAGVAVGLAGLTRPEFAGVAALAAGAYVLGVLGTRGRRTALRSAAALLVPALVVPACVLGAFASVAGTSRLFTENLWPVDFIREAGFRTQESWAPFTATSLIASGGRAVVYLTLLAGVVAAAIRWRAGRPWAFWPLAAAVAGLLLLDGVARALGAFPGARTAVEDEAANLLIGMSWLPALAFVAACWALVRGLRRRPAPLSGSWPLDLALLAVAVPLGARAYDAFTTEGSYAPYYAAPLVLLLGILHERVADRWPTARSAALGTLGAVAAGLAVYAVAGLYADKTTRVSTARGTYVADGRAAPAIQATVDLVRSRTAPDERVLAGPADGGLYFMSDRRPSLYELMLIPGLLDSPADEEVAIRRLEHERVRYVVLGARDFTPYGHPTFGVDYNQRLGSYLLRTTRLSARFGDPTRPAVGSYPSSAFSVYERVG